MVDLSNVKEISIPEGNVKSISVNDITIWENAPKRLPKEYQEVEYIQSDGNQYIITNIYPNGQTGVEVCMGEVLNNSVLFGAYNTTWTTGFGMYCNTNYDFWYHYYSNNQINKRPPTKFVLNFNKGKTTIDGIVYASVAEKTFNVSYLLYLFCGNMGGSIEQRTKCKLYYAKIYANDTLESEYIPCYRKSDGEIGLYDIVQQEFKQNNGSGRFTKGGDV